ncbi:GNAT family N-acetyltransferase [Streptomyces sp. DSM 42041]|uniref:GNAT family N-acetyltransferase n=1 Tax=Streptomyces hazeniae TaxID=3075538 RepID=A0ABU2NKJ5_9ACTN|nr:GNAT family N-acetyltransferase [Streptomyces sp. DSM 42041]MDT0377502.1 GNAT family N-acetyltransferase [Streptomyces sp. DSM 42041]
MSPAPDGPSTLDLASALPHGYRARPSTAEDVDALCHLVGACEREIQGRVQCDPGLVAAELARPGLVPELDTRVVHDPSGALVARAWVNRRSAVDVHPRHRGRGLGAALLDWADARAVQAGSDYIVQTVPDDDAEAVALLRSRGYQRMVTEWLLAFDMPDEPAVPEPPEGVSVRPFPSGDQRAAYELIQDAFDEWQQRRMPYQEWVQHTVERPSFAPAMSALAFAGDQLVGAVVSLDLTDTGDGYIEQVAVRRDHRGRGIARLLLRHAFRAFHRHGRRTCTLGTHSETGALTPYLRMGMQVRHQSTVYRKSLRAT